MKIAVIKNPGQRPYHELTQGSCFAKIYSSTRQKHGTPYSEFILVYSFAGKRVRRTFADFDDAKREGELALTKIGNGQVQVLQLTSRDRDEWVQAKAELEPLGVRAAEAASEYRKAVALLGGKVTLLEAVRHFVASGVAELPERTVGEVLAELLAAKRQDGRSDVYISDLRLRLKRFERTFSGQIKDIRHQDIEAWLRGENMGPHNRNNFANSITSLFRFARQVGYVPKNSTVAETLPKARADEGEIAIFTPSEVAKMLAKLQIFRRELLPAAAIGAFAGLRTAELRRLTWEEIDFEHGHILVTAKKAKTGQRRLVPIQPNLLQWLLPYRGSTGNVCPFRKAQTAIQNTVAKTHTTPGGDVMEAIEWKRNGLRHSYGSYRLPIVNSAEHVALEMGNSRNMVFRHYREIVTPAQAQEYWSITPNMTSGTVYTMSAA